MNQGGRLKSVSGRALFASSDAPGGGVPHIRASAMRQLNTSADYRSNHVALQLSQLRDAPNLALPSLVRFGKALFLITKIYPFHWRRKLSPEILT
jgi:hypothetical protein